MILIRLFSITIELGGKLRRKYYKGLSRPFLSLVAFVTKFTFVFVFDSEICYHMLTNVVCVFSTSRRPWSWVALSRCTNGPLARYGFRGFSPRMCAFLRCSLFSLQQRKKKTSFNWLLLCWVFLTGKRTSVFTCSADWWRRATTTDILQCVNKRIFQQSICVVCGLFGNLLVEIDKNIRLVAHSNN